MDETSRRIEIFAPFSAALDLTKLILFQPFDITKWLVLAFAAFLANLGGGGVNVSSKMPNMNWNFRSSSRDVFEAGSGVPGWVWPLIAIGVVLAIAIVLALMWLSARGKFIFADCVVRNRAAIVEPWKEFKREGNSYFLFMLLIGACVLLLLAIVSSVLWLPLLLNGDVPGGVVFVVGVSLLVIVGIILALALSLIANFMIPVMYRQRCSARQAFSTTLKLIAAYPGAVVLYLLFSVVLWMAVIAISCVLTCVTCCIVAIPYVGTVILLPVYVFFMSYLLLFVRQFGPEYDAWTNVVAIEPPSAPAAPGDLPPPEPPPYQG